MAELYCMSCYTSLLNSSLIWCSRLQQLSTSSHSFQLSTRYTHSLGEDITACSKAPSKLHLALPLHDEYVSILLQSPPPHFVCFRVYLETLAPNQEHTPILHAMCGRLQSGIQFLHAYDCSAFLVLVMFWYTGSFFQQQHLMLDQALLSLLQ